MNIKQLITTVATSLLLVSCGGGALNLSEGGIGGSGFSIGKITAFGSIWVNGVRYDVSQAQFTRDGAIASGQGDYRIGETITIGGSVNADGISGVATSVTFEDALEGTVTAVSNDGETVTVMGQTVLTDALTVFHGFVLLTDLLYDNVVEISGSYDANGLLKATSITLKQTTFTPDESILEVKGTIGNVDLNAKTFTLGTLQVNYSIATLNLSSSSPTAGQYVEVKSLQALQGNTLIASEVELDDEFQQFGEGQEIELEGLVTSFADASRFSVNGQSVRTTANTKFENGSAADIVLNALIEVEGQIDSQGILIAEEVSLKQGSSSDAIELEGTITQLNQATQELTVGGVTVVVDNSTSIQDEVNDAEISIQFSHLRTNDYVEVKGTRLSNGSILALRIKRESPEGDD